MKNNKLEFPKDFLWGAGSSAFQVEGGNVWNDWYQFYIDNDFPDKGCGGMVCDHYNRYEEDFTLAKSLGLNTIRISIEWSRIQKEECSFDKKEIEHYRKVLTFLKKNGFTTFVTLHHFTSPTWFGKKGGWTKKENVEYFTKFTNMAVTEFNDLVDYWITINEPTVYAANSYITGAFPPNKHNPISAKKVIENMALAHIKTYEIIKKIDKNKPVGTVHNGASFIANNHITKTIKPFLDYWRNFYFIDKLKRKYDFIGLNYYFPITLVLNKKYSYTDLGWPICPRGIHDISKQIYKKYKKPIIITENGLADANDEQRADFIRDHLKWLLQAINEGVDIRGYLHWSLTDNLELVEGLGARFGLIGINYETQGRTIKNSAFAYERICKSNSVE